MSVLLQISDPHFGTEQAPVLQALVHFVRAQAPELVMLSGDITQRATRRQFCAARAFIDSLAAPALLALPGNHDIPLFAPAARLFAPYRRYREAFGAELEPSFESAQCLAIGVNTTRWYRHQHGEVSPAQIERVAARLARATSQQLRVVVLHHPVAVTTTADTANLLRGRSAAVLQWAAAGADLILGGHIHLPFVRPLHDVFPACSRALWAVQAGTAASSRVRSGAPNSVNLIRYEPRFAARHCVVERWDWAAHRGLFEQAATDMLPLADVDPAR